MAARRSSLSPMGDEVRKVGFWATLWMIYRSPTWWMGSLTVAWVGDHLGWPEWLRGMASMAQTMAWWITIGAGKRR